MATTKNVTLKSGEDSVWTDTIYQSDGTTKQDVTGWTIQLIITRNTYDSTTLVTKNATLVTPAQGAISFTLTAADTGTTLGIGDFWYRVERVDSSADTVLSDGILSVKPKPA